MVQVYEGSESLELYAEVKQNRLSMIIKDVYGKPFSYKVILNGEPIIHYNGGYIFSEGFVEVDHILANTEYGEVNHLVIETVDNENVIVSKEIRFIGDYYGILFSDENGDYYSTGLGEILKYLIVEPIMAGTSSLVYPVRLINKCPFKVTNIKLWQDIRDMSGVIIELSKGEAPFIAESKLEFGEIELDYNDEITFYVRVRSNPSAMGGGIFDIFVKADPV